MFWRESVQIFSLRGESRERVAKWKMWKRLENGTNGKDERMDLFVRRNYFATSWLPLRMWCYYMSIGLYCPIVLSFLLFNEFYWPTPHKWMWRECIHSSAYWGWDRQWLKSHITKIRKIFLRVARPVFPSPLFPLLSSAWPRSRCLRISNGLFPLWGPVSPLWRKYSKDKEKSNFHKLVHSSIIHILQRLWYLLGVSPTHNPSSLGTPPIPHPQGPWHPCL